MAGIQTNSLSNRGDQILNSQRGYDNTKSFLKSLKNFGDDKLLRFGFKIEHIDQFRTSIDEYVDANTKVTFKLKNFYNLNI